MTSPTRVPVTGRDGTTIATYRWEPDGAPRAIVQLTHGMGEHLLRYQHLATRSPTPGFLVQGQDHRGHGATMAGGGSGILGAAGWAASSTTSTCSCSARTTSTRTCRSCCSGTAWARSRRSSTCSTTPAEITALALTGTAAIDLLEPALDLDAPIDLSASTRRSRRPAPTTSGSPATTPRWTRTWPIRSAASGSTPRPARRCSTPPAPWPIPTGSRGIRSDIPVYITVGDQDPVNGQLALSGALVQRLEAAGLTDVTSVVWPQGRHEILNETNRAEVEADLLAWLDRVVPR